MKQISLIPNHPTVARIIGYFPVDDLYVHTLDLPSTQVKISILDSLFSLITLVVHNAKH